MIWYLHPLAQPGRWEFCADPLNCVLQHFEYRPFHGVSTGLIT